MATLVAGVVEQVTSGFAEQRVAISAVTSAVASVTRVLDRIVAEIGGAQALLVFC